MDETPVSFDLSSSYTLEKHDSNTISIKTTGHERSILDCMADSSKLSSVIIFKLKNKSREKFSNSVFIRTNEKGWVNKEKMINNIWSKRSLINYQILDLFLF